MTNLEYGSTRALICLVVICFAANASGQPATTKAPCWWRDARELTIEGKGWSDTKSFYDRLPARAERVARPSVWRLSHDSAGMRVRFVTDATSISARWTLRNKSLAMPHMPATGVSGLDLYVKEKHQWHWVGAGRPEESQVQEQVLVSGLAPVTREFALYLPLYNGVEAVKIGVSGGTTLESAPPPNTKPIVFYGTSITQGGCAARPGMAYPAMLGRRLDRTTINLGFSGSAICEPEVARLLAELDPSVYVLDPLPNMTDDLVSRRMESFVKTLREAHPKTPIVLIENAERSNGAFVPEAHKRVESKNAKLREVCRRLTKAGEKELFYLPASKLIGDDGLATVDGVHPTDLGFFRMADAMEPILRRALKTSR